MDNGSRLHIVMLPWLALGHLLPFLELSKHLALRGHKISFISTPRNIQRLPRVPHNISHLISFIQFPLPRIETLPEDAEVTIDLPSDDLRPYLKKAFDGLQHDVLTFLRETSDPPADWIVYDYAAYWVPRVSVESGVPCAYLSLFTAATLGVSGSPQVLLGNEHQRTTMEEYTMAPKWVPFPSTITWRRYEVKQIFEPAAEQDASGVTELYRFAATIEGCDFLAIRSCWEFEPDWLQLIGNLFKKPIIPIGMLPPLVREDAHQEENSRKEWKSTFEWLDAQEAGSVVYVAFGSEVKIRTEEVEEIASGLELSNLPFLWAFRGDRLPEGFEEQVKGRGLVCRGWVPQVRILAHPSVGGFLTHGGWNSIVEGLSFGLAMVVLPLIFDQGLNARNLSERNTALEVARNEDDGYFTGEEIGKALRLVMTEEKGEAFRAKARESKDIFGNLEMHEKYLDDFVKYLWEHKQNKFVPSVV